MSILVVLSIATLIREGHRWRETTLIEPLKLCVLQPVIITVQAGPQICV